MSASDGTSGMSDGARRVSQITDHALLQIDIVVIDPQLGYRGEVEQTVMIPLDEAEAHLTPQQVEALRRVRPFSALTKAGDAILGAHATVKAVILTEGEESVPSEASDELTRQARRRRARDRKQLSSRGSGLTLSVAIATSDFQADDVTSYEFGLTELEAQLSAEHLTSLRHLQPLTVTKQCEDMWVVFALDCAAANESVAGGQTNAPRLRLVR